MQKRRVLRTASGDLAVAVFWAGSHRVTRLEAIFAETFVTHRLKSLFHGQFLKFSTASQPVITLAKVALGRSLC